MTSDLISSGICFCSLYSKVSCADSIVGDAKVRGISGGEKKRLSLACELIASPSVVFADEPTTGMHALCDFAYAVIFKEPSFASYICMPNFYLYLTQ